MSRSLASDAGDLVMQGGMRQPLRIGNGLERLWAENDGRGIAVCLRGSDGGSAEDWDGDGERSRICELIRRVEKPDTRVEVPEKYLVVSGGISSA